MDEHVSFSVKDTKPKMHRREEWIYLNHNMDNVEKMVHRHCF